MTESNIEGKKGGEKPTGENDRWVSAAGAEQGWWGVLDAKGMVLQEGKGGQVCLIEQHKDQSPLDWATWRLSVTEPHSFRVKAGMRSGWKLSGSGLVRKRVQPV